ncbi:MAG: hypothetical protein HQL56_11350 [Magnetococcales bacterium]|nr:hypothetical protein [Magnetococcales bacterium]
MFSYILLAGLFLVAVIWGLVRLRRIRERAVAARLPSDEGTVMLGLFLVLSQSCLRYHKDKGRYPQVISGAQDGLIEQGYLKGNELASLTKSLPLFSIVASEHIGYGICLMNTTPALARALVERVQMAGNNLQFLDFKSDRYVSITPPIKNEIINLTLPLPLKPKHD